MKCHKGKVNRSKCFITALNRKFYILNNKLNLNTIGYIGGINLKDGEK